jgi:hypothetical protein
MSQLLADQLLSQKTRLKASPIDSEMPSRPADDVMPTLLMRSERQRKAADAFCTLSYQVSAHRSTGSSAGGCKAACGSCSGLRQGRNVTRACLGVVSGTRSHTFPYPLAKGIAA